MPAGSRDLERAFGTFLALDVAQVELRRFLRMHLGRGATSTALASMPSNATVETRWTMSPPQSKVAERAAMSKNIQGAYGAFRPVTCVPSGHSFHLG